MDEISILKTKTSNPLVSDYLDLWGESTRVSSERLLHIRKVKDPRERKKNMPGSKLSADQLISNSATKYFPEFVNIVIHEKAKGKSLEEKFENIQANLPEGDLKEHIQTKIISDYIAANKAKMDPDLLVAQLDAVAKENPEYDNWVGTVRGFRSYLKRGDSAPEDVLFSSDGTEFKISDFKGKYLFIDFWASWCVYCIKEMPDLEKIKQEFADSDIQFIGISLDDNQENWKKAMEKYDLKENQFIVSSPDFAEKLGLSSIPRYIIYDREGRMLYPDTPRPRQYQQLSDLLKSLV